MAMSSRTRFRIMPLIAVPVFLALPAAVQGQTDFTFRRIAVAPQSEGPRITVQIDPEEQARRLALPVGPGAPGSDASAAAPVARVAPGSSERFGWFWDQVRPDGLLLPGRFNAAMQALSDPPRDAPVPQPRLQSLQAIATRHGADILRASVGTQVSPALALAVISVESAGRAQAVSHAGAQGLMQLIPATAARFGVSDAFDPAQNIRGGIAYLDWLLGEFDRDIVLALAGYNAGEGAVRRAAGVPPYAETRDYVPQVLAAWTVARGLCLTLPDLPTDGCVFRVQTGG